jgi:2-methylcitrate dehydratase PrpD
MNTKEQTILQTFADYFCAGKYNQIPSEVVHKSKLLVVDLVGVAIAGLKMDFPKMMIDYLADLQGKPEATLFGSSTKVPALHAALGNGVSGHALDMDDGYRFGGVHAGVAVIPAALAYAEANKASGQSLLLSIIMGYEIVNRISKAMNPSHLNRGFHTTGTLGVLGAAAACGVLGGLNKEQMSSAMSIAALQGAGLLQILTEGAMVKPLHPGKAAMAGVLSVDLAKRGANGPVTALEGQKGLFKAMADEVKLDALFEGLGSHFYLHDQYIKLHAACRHVHPTVDGVQEIMRKQQLNFADIESVDIATYPVAISFCGAKEIPDSAEGAKFSLAYSVAMAAYYGDVGEDRYVQSVVANKEIQGLANRINATLDDKWTKAYPASRGASIVLKTKQGATHSVDVPLAKGEPENPASDEDIIAKYRHNAEGQDPAVVEQLLQVLLSLEKHSASDVTALMAKMRRG